ncbi:MAG: PcfJ domain-containing protein [Myxococcales bacterium]
MATQSFGRHGRRLFDAALRCALRSFASPQSRDSFERLVRVARERSSLLGWAPGPRQRLVQLEALVNLASWQGEHLREPERWEGACGHPLAVVASLAAHLLAAHPAPRFLASAWLGGDERAAWRRWYTQHVRGQPFRSLALPMPMTRRMEHLFLHSPDHLAVDHALRRAEVLALGGSAELAGRVLDTRLAHVFEPADFWRRTLEWLVRWEDEIDPAQIGPIVDFLFGVRCEAVVHTAQGQAARAPLRPDFELRGRTPASLMREVTGWHSALGRGPASPKLSWPASRWQGLSWVAAHPDDEEERVEYRVVELLDSAALVAEGRAMHHCVASYAWSCSLRRSAIWSVRRHVGEETQRPAITVEVDPRSATIVQARGPSNRRPSGRPLEVLRAWASRERLRFSSAVELFFANTG